MNNSNNEEITLINGQILGIILFIITLIISLLLAYNEKLLREEKNSLFSNKQALDISLINRIVVVLLGFYFVYDAYKRKEINNSEDFNSNLQILASWLALLASLIILYIIILNYNNTNFDVSEIEEPTL